MQVRSVLSQVQDGIAHQLPRAMVRDVAAAIDSIDRRTVGAEHVRADEKVIRRSAPSDRVDGIVLEEKEAFRAAVAHARCDCLLHPPRVDVGNPPQPCGVERVTQG